jgi:hypothetical protein
MFLLGNEIPGIHMWTGGTRGLGGHTWTGGTRGLGAKVATAGPGGRRPPPEVGGAKPGVIYEKDCKAHSSLCPIRPMAGGSHDYPPRTCIAYCLHTRGDQFTIVPYV